MRILLLTTITMIMSCNSHDTNWVEFKLPEDLGKFIILLPFEMDSIYQWVDYKDNHCDNRIKYRASKSNLIHKETGYIENNQPQSKYQFTISHKPIDCFFGIKIGTPNNEVIDLVKIEKIEKKKNPSAEIKIKEIKSINDKDYQIISIINETFEQLILLTNISGKKIQLDFDCFNSDCSNFSNKMYELIENIKFTDDNNCYEQSK